MGEVVDLFSKTKVSAKCMLCKTVHTRTVDTDSLGLYLYTDRLVQDCFPYEDTATREILIGNRSGAYLCETCCIYEEE
jgi:hypothetical protein